MTSLLDSVHHGESDVNSEDDEAVQEDRNGEGKTSDASIHLNKGGKKDSFTRRQELLVNSGLAEVCTSILSS